MAKSIECVVVCYTRWGYTMTPVPREEHCGGGALGEGKRDLAVSCRGQRENRAEGILRFLAISKNAVLTRRETLV